MKEFNPIEDVENSDFVLDNGKWPNFHDAEIHNLSIWRGDVQPDDDVWIGPVIEVTIELCALRNPYMVVLKFHNCESIKIEGFNHQNAVYDLNFNFEDRGTQISGEPLTPYITVKFEPAFGSSLSFKCFRIEAINCSGLP
ncbi:MAG: immunity 50 family protein [Gammaproteobacteria bacterium]|nr:immunity 50 family protein [Gammaproteobacteria bacterium]